MFYLNFQLDFNSVLDLFCALKFYQTYLSDTLKTVNSSEFSEFSKSLNCINSLISDFEKVISSVENMEEV